MQRIDLTASSSNQRSAHHQRGFSMIELMIALLIALFLLGGLMGLVQSNKAAFLGQNQLSQLQDSERLAISMLTDVIEQAGYFPDPTLNTAASTMPAVAPFAQGQSLYGTYNFPSPDTISVRYTTANNDGIINCMGGTNSTGSNHAYTNTFSIVVTGGVSQLVCTRETGTVYPLVSNVAGMSILYGVNTSGSGNNVDTYMTATQVTAAADWNNVISAQVTLKFNNLLYPNAGQPQYFTIVRTINIMNQTG
jgi:type IV pilus assembly protein PilW